MNQPRIAHLHVRSEFSLLQSAARIDQLVRTARERGAFALALTDLGNLSGIVSFYKACQKYSVKPIAGVELKLIESETDPSDRQTHAFPVLLLAETQPGYENLLKLATLAHLNEDMPDQPCISLDSLSKHADGILLISAWEEGAVSNALIRQQDQLAHARVHRLRQLFGEDRLFLEVQDRGRTGDRLLNERIVRLSEETGIRLVAAQTISYLNASDAEVLMTVEAIRQGRTLTEIQSAEHRYIGQEFPEQDDYLKKFQWLPHALHTAAEIAERCKVTIEIGATHLPAYPLPPHYRNADEYLRELAYQGAKSRFASSHYTDSYRNAVQQRLDEELQMIAQLKFSSYFLIVWDFMDFAHRNGITTGPGRGSAAGSLVAYVLRITDVDPLRYGLLMERFLNPERVTWPDIDIDFEYERRGEVIQYVTERFGRDHVAQIATFGTLAAKAAIRDVGRVLGKPQAEIDRLAKLIPNQLGITLDQALKDVEELANLVNTNETIRRWMELARRIEGLPRHSSIHAAGVVIASEPLTRFTALTKGPDRGAVTQLAMEDLEAIGLLKMDFLGLRTLTLVDRVIRQVELRTGESIQFDDRMDDQKTYELLARGHTDGCFQLESSGVKLVLRELKPTTFEDIIAVISLYRPGPMENIPSFIKAKHGKIPIVYPHPALEPILRDTYGVIVYQEQIMQIASFMAGFSLGQADLLRRAVGKKKREVLDEQREIFVKGCIGRGYSESTANDVYDLIVRFADYGFNRSHAAAYGVLSYRTAYLKAHFPAEFMAALLSMNLFSQEKLARYVEEARRMGLQVMPPDINASGADFSAESENGSVPSIIRFGLSAVKHVGSAAIRSILSEREKHGPYLDLHDVCRRVDLRVVNRRVLESLICAGAFDFTGATRRSLLAGLDPAISYGSEHSLREENQISLFSDIISAGSEQPALPELTEFPADEVLRFELEAIGIYCSGHPLDPYRTSFAEKGCMQAGEIGEADMGKEYWFGGKITRIKPIRTRKGQQMAFLEIEDFTGTVEGVVFPAVYTRYEELLQPGQIVFLKAGVQGDGEDRKLTVEAVERVQLNEPGRKTVYIKITEKMETLPVLNRLKRILSDHPGQDKIRLVYLPRREQRQLAQTVGWSLELESAIRDLLGYDAIFVREE